MARPKRFRRIADAPIISGMIPYGKTKSNGEDEVLFLNYEEYEAIRLNDYQNLRQCQSASIMGVSRPTFTRIYISARQKVATALVEGRKIIIEGGKVYFDNDWFKCNMCSCTFNIPSNSSSTDTCPLCGSRNVASCGSNDSPKIPSDDQPAE